MALDFLEGEPGGGKSYTAVKEFIIPALKAGRAVVTDIPLVLPEINRITGRDCEDLVWNLRESDLGRRPFSQMADFDPGWKRPATNPDGSPMLNPETKEPLIERALCVVDEAHEVWPATGAQKLSVEWDSFFGKHRHYGLDIVLLTQDSGYVHVALRKRMRMRYRLVNMAYMGVRAMYFLETYRGQSKTRQNLRFGRYQKKVYRCYNSFTGGGASSAPKARAIWRQWRVYLILGSIGYALYSCSSGNLMKPPIAGYEGREKAVAPGAVDQVPQSLSSGAVDLSSIGALTAEAAKLRAQADVELAARELALVQASICIYGDGGGPGRASSVAAVSLHDGAGAATGSSVDCRLVPRPPPPPRHLLAGAEVRIGATVVYKKSAAVWLDVRRDGQLYRLRLDQLNETAWRFTYFDACNVGVSGPWSGALTCDWLWIPS